MAADLTAWRQSLPDAGRGELRVGSSEPHARILEALFGTFTGSLSGGREGAAFVVQAENMPVSMRGA